MKLSNFASLDPVQQGRDIKGLSNASKLDRAIWDEFHSNWETLAIESEQASEIATTELAGDGPVGSIIPAHEKTEVKGEARIRLVQRFFRSAVLSAYDFRCSVCALELKQLLVASHIIPWAKCEGRRADPTNGLSLCSLHDRAFDRGFFTLDEELRVVLSPDARLKTDSQLQTVALLGVEGKRLRIPTRFCPDQGALQFHRLHIYRS